MENGGQNAFSNTGAFSAGYQLTSVLLNRVFNITLAIILLVAALPLVLLLILVVTLCDGLPVFYKVTRLGQDKKPFTMYKFRTLVADADEIIGAKVFAPERDLMTPFGKFFRDTRLDELPQLINILKGDMDFIGPRPVRPAIYDSVCRHIPNYDRRFVVPPGLVGYAQLFTPYSSPKRIRTLIDNTLLRKKRRMLWDVGIVLYAIGVVLRTTAVRVCTALYRGLILSRILRRYREKRSSERISPRNAIVRYYGNGNDRAPDGEAALIDLNEKAFLMRSSEPIADPFPETFRLQIEIRRSSGNRTKRKAAICKGKLFREIERIPGKHDYVILFEPTSPLNYYVVHQYFLVESFGAMA